MTKMFGNMTNEGLEESKDTVGGFQTLTSDVYPLDIQFMYVSASASSKAQAINIVGKIGDAEYRERIWITNKNGENSYPDKQDASKRHPLPGFTTIDDICNLTTGFGLAAMDTVEKHVKVYDPEQKKEVAKPVQVIEQTMGKRVLVAVLEVEEYKQKKNDAGVYVNTDEIRTKNEIDKVFHSETGRTVNEYRHKVETAEFREKWLERNKDKKRPPRGSAGKTGGGAGASGSGRPGAAAGGSAGNSLFG